MLLILRKLDFAGLIEPARNSLCIKRSHKLEASTDVHQNDNLALLDVMNSTW